MLSDKFSTPTFPLNTDIVSVGKNNSSNPKNCAQITETRADMLPVLSNTVHHGIVCGLPPTQIGGKGGEIGTLREFTALFNFSNYVLISLAQHCDFHASDVRCKWYTYHSRTARNIFLMRVFYGSRAGSRLKLCPVNLASLKIFFINIVRVLIPCVLTLSKSPAPQHDAAHSPNILHQVNSNKHLRCTVDRLAVLPSRVRSHRWFRTTFLARNAGHPCILRHARRPLFVEQASRNLVLNWQTSPQPGDAGTHTLPPCKSASARHVSEGTPQRLSSSSSSSETRRSGVAAAICKGDTRRSHHLPQTLPFAVSRMCDGALVR